jgi:lysophospholipase L1-like esterase
MFSTHSVIYISLLVVLLVSLILNGVLFYTAKHYYTRAKLAEVFPSHENYYQQANATLPQKTQKRVVLFGNSRIQDWKKLPQLDGFEFINRGIGGETTAQNQARFLKDVLALKPDVVILQTGMNDLTVLGVQPQRYKEITRICQDNLKFFVESLLAQQVEVILLTIIPPAQPELARRLVWDEKISQSVEEINQYWLNLPTTERLHIIDSAKVLKDAQGRWHNDVNKDTLHLTPTGYNYLNQALTPILKKSPRF